MLGSAGGQAADAVTIGTVGASPVNNWPSYIAQSKGYFEAAGITPDVIFPPSSSNLVQQLTAGSVDMALSVSFQAGQLNAIAAE
jgi:ABC-type nitrate/sulfonate/bicarbonate transport system substrate-binding protein